MAPGRRTSIAVFIALGSVVVAIAVALNVGWIILNWRTGVLAVLGVIFFLIIITGVVLNTIFLVREIRRNDQHDAFINAVTHELKTPVASMRLYLQTLQTRDVDESKRREFYSRMLADNDRLMETIENVLLAGRLRVRRTADKQRLDLHSVVTECVALASSRYHTEIRYDGGTPTFVLGEPDQLRAAVSNLIDNAVKYSTGEVDICVSLSRSAEGHALIRVSDRGVGIPPAELKRIFRRFYRIPSIAARVKGTGLGLFIVQSVAKKHGGRVWAESGGLAQGSTFTIELPVI